MGELVFQELPIIPDQGLPQAFSCTIGAGTYEFGVYANVDVADTDPAETIYDLGPAAPSVEPVSPRGFLVLRATRPGPDGADVVLLRKLVAEPGLLHHTAELAFRLDEARVARGNLNGPGHFGSRIRIAVALRWA